MRNIIIMIVIAAFAGLVVLVSQAASSAVKKERNYFYDGDTVSNISYRLAYIDAPERAQKCTIRGQEYPIGRLATLHLQEISNQSIKECLQVGYDSKWDRPVVDCGYNLQMVDDGWAVCSDQNHKLCIEKQKKAEKQKLGLWACDEIITPSEYRHGKK